eukprot:UN22953
MDWAQIRAVDVYTMMNSFIPEGGQIKEVIIYPTDIGNKYLEVEQRDGLAGVQKLIEEERGIKSKNDNSRDGFDAEELRYYQLLRMRYYFALIDCDSVKTADALYSELDGMEFEHSANQIDLRFIGGDWEAKYEVRDRASSTPSNYKAPTFFTQAVQHSNVKDNWDENPKYR